jgi:hypothetical protein
MALWGKSKRVAVSDMKKLPLRYELACNLDVQKQSA